MADLKISQLTDGGASQAADEYVVARSGSNFRIDGASVAAAATSVGTLSSLTVSGDLTVDTNTLYVDAANNRVGIGTTSPSEELTVAGNTTANVYKFRANTSAPASTDAFLYRPADNTLAFGTASAEKMRLDASGNLGLGVTPSAWGAGLNALQVGANSYASLFDFNNGVTFLSSNLFWTGSAYSRISASSRWSFAYSQDTTNGAHTWLTSTVAGTSTPTMSTLMTLDASGNLLVGTTTTSSLASAGRGLIEVNGSSDSSFALKASDTLYGYLYSSSTSFRIANATANPLTFFTDNTERARITSGGYFKASNTGTYTGSTAAYHELYQTANDHTATLTNTNASLTTAGVLFVQASRNTTNNTFYALSYYNSGAAAYKFLVADSGDVTNTNGSYTAISDAKLKQDIIDAPSQWDDIKATRFRKYRFKADVERLGDDAPYLLGVVAQELEQTSPGCIDEHPDYEEQEVTDEDGNVTTERVKVGSTKSFKQSVYLMKAAVALQEAMARIEALEARLEALEA